MGLQFKFEGSSLQKGMSYFFLLGIIFIPFPYYIFPFQSYLSNLLFSEISIELATFFTGLSPVNLEITSDSLTLYFLVFILFGIAFFMILLEKFFSKLRFSAFDFSSFFRVISSCFLALILLKYGFDKLFKAQFYLPEPNILFTPFGDLDKDILFWSTMGTSYSYNIFMGFLEVIPAVFLLFRRTRIVGLLIAHPVLFNIVAINFSFDISVKVFSLFLLSLNLFLILPYLNQLWSFLVLEKQVSLKSEPILFPKRPSFRFGLKIFVIGLFFLEALFPYLNSLNFNDDLVQRPYLHGAYEVIEMQSKSDSISSKAFSFKRIFIHRKGYLIFQNHQDEMTDFRLEVDSMKQKFRLIDYDLKERLLNFEYNEKDSILNLSYDIDNQEFIVVLKQLNWQQMPALKNGFHWTIESVN